MKPKFYFTNQTVDRKHAREIELKIEQQTGLQLENPFYDGEAKEVRSLDSTGTSDMSPDEICGVDLRKIRDCEGIVALMTSDRDIGSCMEIAICSFAWGKPVYIIAPNANAYNHPWIQYFATALFENHYGFIKYAISKWGKNAEPKKPEISCCRS